MRVAIADPYGCGVGIAARLEAEGSDVLLWTPRGRGRDKTGLAKVGRGIVPTADGYEELADFARDTTEPSLLLFLGSGLGAKADDARRAGIHVIGASAFCDRAEKDRAFGFKLAEEMGAMVPYTQPCGTLSEAIKYAEGLGSQATYFKSDRYIDADTTMGAKDGQQLAEHLTSLRAKHGDRMRCVVQDKIEGVAISTERFFNGREFVGPFFGLIEKKRFMNDEVGPSTGCSLNAVWTYGDDDPRLATELRWHNLAAILRKHEAPPGIYDANAVVDDEGDPFFLEWCARFGWDSEATGMRLIGDYGRFLWWVATGQGDAGEMAEPGTIAFSTRLSVPPYPLEDLDLEHPPAVGKPIRGTDGLWDKRFVAYQLMAADAGYAMASPEGMVGLSLAVGPKLSALGEEVVAFAKDEMRVRGLQYRTDGAAVVKADAEKLNAVLDDLPKGLVE